MHGTAGTLSPELRILSYLSFVLTLFIFPDPAYFLVLFFLLFFSLMRIPFRRLKSGWLPISMFLLFTFISNVFNHHGRILFVAGPVMVTHEGLILAAMRSARILLMIGGVKLLTATTPADDLIHALARLLGPIERAGIPVRDFFQTVGLTLKCFPVLQDLISAQYRKSNTGMKGETIWTKMKMLATFLLPLFVESIRHPERFFGRAESGEESR